MQAVPGLRIHVRFDGELNDFLPPERRNTEFEYLAGATDTVKHIVESLGVPHTEIERIQADGQVVPLSWQPVEGQHLHVLPHILQELPHGARFVLDGHLGRLAGYLRMLGFDVWYDRFADDVRLATIAKEEQRVLLTRDVGLLKRREVEQGYWIRGHQPPEQVREVVRRFGLMNQIVPFQRCIACNGDLRPVPKSEVAELVPPYIRETKDEFSRCLACAKIYWRGSHYLKMLAWIEDLRRGHWILAARPPASADASAVSGMPEKPAT
jgi:uncharacterized protein with PIN domain